MTTQEQKNSHSQGIIGSDDFTIRTMHGDLSNPGSFLGDHTENAIEPINHELPKAATNSVFEPKNTSPFSQEIPENITLTSQSAPQPQKTFLQKNLPVSTFPPTAKEPSSLSAAKTDLKLSRKKSSGLSIVITIIILIIIALGAGAYYLFFVKSSPVQQSQQTQAQPQQNTTIPQTQNQTPVAINPPTEKYSPTNPNYLPLDIAGASSTDILKTLSNISPDIETSSATVPIEFTVVDTNNNPVVFHIFAAALKINLSPNVLASLGDNFSLYYFKDASSIVRLGLSVDVKDPIALKSALLKEEPALPMELSPLFLGATPTIKTGLFKDSSYNNFAIRYLNLDSQNDLSVDYVLTNSQLVIGTSKNTLRSILNKQATTSPANPTTTPAGVSPIVSPSSSDNNQ